MTESRKPTASRDLSAADYRALADFRYQIRRFLHFSETAARQEGIEPQQHQMLLALCAHGEPGPTIGEVAERLMIQHHSAVGLVDRMEARGLVERSHTGKDRRQVQISLIADGREMLRRLSELHQEELRRTGPLLVNALERVLAGLPPEI